MRDSGTKYCYGMEYYTLSKLALGIRCGVKMAYDHSKSNESDGRTCIVRYRSPIQEA